MNRLPAKLTAFAILLIISVPVLLSLNFILKEILIEQEVEGKMKTKVLQSIRIAKSDIAWTRAGAEALVDGKLFDVKYFETDDEDIITLTGLFDSEETELLSDLKKYIEQTGNNNPVSEFAFKFQFSPFYNNYFKINCETTWHCISNQYHAFVTKLPIAPSLALIHPPQLQTQTSFFV